MSRSVIKRALGVLVALTFGLNSAELRAVHSCPMHDGPVAAASETSGHHAHQAGTSQDAPAPERHGCTCPDASCGAGAAAAIPATIVSAAVAPRLVSALLPFSNAELPRSRTPHLLPWSQGPPASELIA